MAGTGGPEIAVGPSNVVLVVMCGVRSSAIDGFRSSAKTHTSSVFRNEASGFGMTLVLPNANGSSGRCALLRM